MRASKSALKAAGAIAVASTTTHAAPPASQADPTPLVSAATTSSSAITPVPLASSPQPAAQATPASATCVEHLPTGKARPLLTESFPDRGVSGHGATLRLTLKHGKGERVLPGALSIQSDSDAAKSLRAAGFVLPDVTGPGRPRVRTESSVDSSETRVRITVVPLPKKAGRYELVLPPLPVAMARASGEVITLCTRPHTITVEDPVVNKPMAMPKGNPKPQRQIEAWDSLRNAVYGVGAGLLLAAMIALFYAWWKKRPKKMAPPPPPRPAWELALESLYDIRQARLVEQGRLHDHFDRVSHTLKEYLGRRFDFDGLESTTEEILSQLEGSADALAAFPQVHRFLSESDLVKFAKQTPTEEQCHSLMERAETVIRSSTPSAPVAQTKADPG